MLVIFVLRTESHTKIQGLSVLFLSESFNPDKVMPNTNSYKNYPCSCTYYIILTQKSIKYKISRVYHIYTKYKSCMP